jgi:hypothetical protein
VLLAAFYGLFDFLAPVITGPLLDGRRGGYFAFSLVAAIAGCALAQFGALAVWGVMGTGRPIVRLTGSLATAVLLLCSLFAGGIIGAKDLPRWRELSAPLQILPLAYLSVQIPLWAMSIGWGYRIVAAGAIAPPPQRFTLRGLFFATAVVAAALGLLQVAWPAEARGQTIVMIAICLIGGPAWGVLVVLPCLLSAFLPSTPNRGIAFLLAYGGVLSLALIGADLAFSDPGSPPGAFDLLAFELFFGTIAFTLFGTFLVLRNYGYKLRRIKIEPPGSSA